MVTLSLRFHPHDQKLQPPCTAYITFGFYPNGIQHVRNENQIQLIAASQLQLYLDCKHFSPTLSSIIKEKALGSGALRSCY